MRILVVSDTYLPLVGGAEVHVSELVRRLKNAGHDVRLFTNQEGADEDGVTRVPWHRNFFEVYGKLDALCARFKPDVIASHYSYRLAMIAGFSALKRGIPMTVTLHGLGTLPEAHASWRPRLQNFLYQRLSLAFASKVIATSQDMLDAVPYVTAKTVIIPNAADGERFDPRAWDADAGVSELRRKHAGRSVILTVRRLNPKCGIQYLVEAMPEIVKRRPDVLYVMVGTGRLEDAICARVKALGLETHVEMIGLLPNDKTPGYFAASDLVVFPSTAESTSISCIEAMLMEKPVVASRVGGLIELLGTDGTRGRLVKLVDWEASNYEAPPVEAMPKERISALADAICDLLDDAEARRKMGEQARQYALAHFDWNVVMKRTIDIYESLAASVRGKA